MTRHTLEETIKADRNIVAAGLLQDLALLQGSPQSAFGYKRAAKALAAGIDRSVVDLIEEGTLRDVPFVGASSERLVAELVRTGTAASVDARVDACLPLTGSAQYECWASLDQYLMLEVVPWTPLAARRNVSFAGPRVTSYSWDELSHTPAWDRIGVSQPSD